MGSDSRIATSEPRLMVWGEGRISGVAGVLLGALSLFAVLCFQFPEWLTTPELRALYPLPAVRILLFGALLLTLVLGLVSSVLQRRAGLGAAAIALAGVAIALGGAWVETEGPVESRRYVGLDWFVLDLLILAVLFVPLERLFPLRPLQPRLRPGFKTDLAHFFASHLCVQLTVLLTMAPAAWMLRGAIDPDFQASVAALPFLLQLMLAVVLADLFQYVAHRAFHQVPLLWRFHSIHHSSRAMDWLAGSRLHLVDIVATRAVGFVPLYAMGFAEGPLSAYLVVVGFHAVFIHTNVRWALRPLRWLVTTPRYHHWHHASDPAAVDKNFAVQVPLIDWLFGTAYQPDAWPEAYGIAGDPIRDRWLEQLVGPFGRRWPQRFG